MYRKRSYTRKRIHFVLPLVLLLLIGLAAGAQAVLRFFEPDSDGAIRTVTNRPNEITATDTPAPSSLQKGKIAPVAAKLPAQLFNLAGWQLTLPIDTSHAGDPDLILQPELAGYSLSPWFISDVTQKAVIFRTTAGSQSELRETVAWSPQTGTHTLSLQQSITHQTKTKPYAVAGQIQTKTASVVQIRLEGSRLFVWLAGKDVGVLDADYKLGTSFVVKMEVGTSKLTISYNDVRKVTSVLDGDGYHFAAGSSAVDSAVVGNPTNDYAETVVYALEVKHL